MANPLAGGSELLVDELAKGLAQRGVEVSLLCGGPVAASFHYETVQSGGTYSQFVRVPFSYRRRFRSTDLVVEVCNGMPFLAPLWRRGPTLCLVNHVHTELWKGRFNPAIAAFGRAIESRVMPFVHRRNLIVTVSPSTRASLRTLGVADERIWEIPLGVEEPPASVSDSEEPLFVAVGRIVGYKRVDLLLKIWKSVYPVVGGKLVIVGDGPGREALEAQKIDGVEFVGYVSEEEKHRLLCQAWVLVHPASWEGWGLVITEAAVRGTPSIGFDVPGVKDAIQPDVTGLVASTEEEFAQQWITLAQNPARRDELGANARALALGTPWSKTVDRFMAAATEAIARERKHRTVEIAEAPAVVDAS
jgi:glycosyltransferase involved in cell wall biosynthesis